MELTVEPHLVEGKGGGLPRAGDPGTVVRTWLVSGPRGVVGDLKCMRDQVWCYRLNVGKWTGEYPNRDAALSALKSELEAKG